MPLFSSIKFAKDLARVIRNMMSRNWREVGSDSWKKGVWSLDTIDTSEIIWICAGLKKKDINVRNDTSLPCNASCTAYTDVDPGSVATPSWNEMTCHFRVILFTQKGMKEKGRALLFWHYPIMKAEGGEQRFPLSGLGHPLSFMSRISKRGRCLRGRMW